MKIRYVLHFCPNEKGLSEFSEVIECEREIKQGELLSVNLKGLKGKERSCWKVSCVEHYLLSDKEIDSTILILSPAESLLRLPPRHL